MSKKTRSAAVIFAVLMVLASVLLGGCAGQKGSAQPVYTVYFGLNDAKTGVQAVAADEAASYIRGVITGAGYGYTEYDTHGAYVENGVAYENETLVYMLTYIDDAGVKKICADVKAHFNLDSVFFTQSDMICGYAE